MTKSIAFIIEDDPVLADVFAGALKTAHYETTIFYDGQTALEQLVQEAPDMIILDLHLPHVSGVDILHQIKAAGHLAKTRIIIASADAALADRLRPQVDLVLMKPVSFHQLRAMSARLHPDSVAAPSVK